MTHDEALHLLSARIDGPLAPDQARGLDAWLAEAADNRVLAEAFQAQHIDLSSAFEPRREAAAKTAAAVARQLPPTVAPAPPGQSARPASWRRRLASPLSGGVAAALLVAAGLFFFQSKPNPDAKPPGINFDGNLLADVGMKPRAKPIAPKTVALGIGESASTKAGEKRRVVLPDGSLVYLNQNTSIELPKDRQVKLLAGEVFIEAIPADAKLGKFLVETPKRAVTALGTKFAVSANAKGTGVVVTQGKVEVSGLDSKLTTGQELLPGVDAIAAAPRASATLDWTRDLMAAAESPLVPAGKYSGGSLVAVDPYGQEAKLSLVKYHVDVHIEDGFARTTIDQTYFNSENSQMEGTFYFPLPPDASLSRLAMYVDGNRMEGGMAERDHARNVYETIRYQRRDPALLEWVDGSVFKMRVFPLEARQEKRIILSYTQKLPVLYGRTSYRFPSGHTLAIVDQWSFKALVKDGSRMSASAPSHPAMKFEAAGTDLVLTDEAKNIKADRDVVLEFVDHGANPNAQEPRWSAAQQDGQKYLMLRYRPDLPSAPRRERRDWVVLFESSGARDPLVARAQVEVVRSLLTHAEHEDTFAVLTVGTRVRKFAETPLPATTDNIAQAVSWLEGTHLIGALNLEQALNDVQPLLRAGSNPYLVHVGGGIASIGEQRAAELVKRIPAGTRYVGIGVGKRFSPAFMKVAAERTGGLFSQVNPDEPISWRGFELASTLNAPRLLNMQIETPGLKDIRFLTMSNGLSHGEELTAVANVTQAIPQTVVVRGLLDGQPFIRTVPLGDISLNANYLPRTWAKLEIDRLLADSSTDNKKAIIDLSKAMYVMTPYTSLLVLENEQMYRDFKVDRGRKDHWAMYRCPDKIPVVYIPDPNRPAGAGVDLKGQKPHENQVMQTIMTRRVPKFLTRPGQNNNDQPIETAGQRFSDPRPEPGNALAQLGDGDFSNWQLGSRLDVHSSKSESFSQFQRTMFRRNEVSRSRNQEEFNWNTGNDWVDIPASGDLSLNRPLGRAKYLVATSPPVLPVSRTALNDPNERMTQMIKVDKDAYEDVLKSVRESQIGSYVHNGKGFFSSIEFLYTQLDGETHVMQAPKLTPLNNIEYFNSIRSARDQSPQPIAVLAAVPPLPALFNRDRLFDPTDSPDSMKRELSESVNRFRIIAGVRELNDFGVTGSIVIDDSRSMSRTVRASGSAPPYYGRPSFNGNQRVFTDLVAYAPGMSSSPADIRAVQEAEAAQRFGARRGAIDPAARKIIDAARTATWKTTTIPLGEGKSLAVLHDGQGRYAYERQVGLGLIERVVCDGTTLWHLYPELGIGAKRTVSRFHREALADIAPDFVPLADDMNYGADVKAVDAHTVALVPVKPERSEEAPKAWLEMHLVFDGDRLAERRWMLMPSNKILAREVYDATGSAKVVISAEKAGEKDKEVVVVQRERQAASAPNLQPDVSKLVVLSLPLRDRNTVYQSLGLNPNVDLSEGPNACYEYLDAESALGLLACEFAANNGSNVSRIWHVCFRGKGDVRPGFLTLLVSTGYGPNERWGLRQALEQNPNDQLVRYLWMTADDDLRDWQARFGFAPARTLRGDFLGKLDNFRNLVTRWQGNYTSDDIWGQRDEERRRALTFVEQNADNVLGWCTLGMVADRIPTSAAAPPIAAMWGRLAKTSAFPYFAQYEQARCLASAEKYADAQKAFQELFRKALSEGVLPPLDSTFRSVLEQGDQDSWAKLIRETAGKCADKKARPAIITLAWQCNQLGDTALSDTLLDEALKNVPAEEKPYTNLAAIHFLNATSRYDRADQLVRDLLADSDLAKSAALWRLASSIADSRKDAVRGIECLEKAMDFEFAALPDVFDVQPIRNDYGRLLTHYEWLADASTTLKVAPPSDLVQRVVKAADRWRMLDPEAGDLGNRVATALRKIGGEATAELAWDYATTPLAMKPGESSPWVSLAWSLRQEGNWRLADKCYEMAFAAEPTDAQLLWDRAQHLEQQGQIAEGRALKKRLADSEWQPRFAGLKAQARQAIEGR